jgi:hypothetical protein
MTVDLTHEQDLHAAAAGAAPNEACADDARAVEHEQIAGPEQRGQLAKDAVCYRAGAGVEMQ